MGSVLIPAIAVFLTLIGSSNAINCYQMNQQMTMQNQWYSCPATVSQCFKFVCAGPTYYITKGCYDITDPRTNCQTLQAQCGGQAGSGQCYYCNKNKCNASNNTTYSIAFVLLAAVSAISSKHF